MRLVAVAFVCLVASACGSTVGSSPEDLDDELFEYRDVLVAVGPAHSGAPVESVLLGSFLSSTCAGDAVMPVDVTRSEGIVVVSPRGQTRKSVEAVGDDISGDLYSSHCEAEGSFTKSLPLEPDDSTVRVVFRGETAEFELIGEVGARMLGDGEGTSLIRRDNEDRLTRLVDHELPEQLYEYRSVMVSVGPAPFGEPVESVVVGAFLSGTCSDGRISFDVRREAGVLEVSPRGESPEDLIDAGFNPADFKGDLFETACEAEGSYRGSVPLDAGDEIVRVWFRGDTAEFEIEGEVGERRLGAGPGSRLIERDTTGFLDRRDDASD